MRMNMLRLSSEDVFLSRGIVVKRSHGSIEELHRCNDRMNAQWLEVYLSRKNNTHISLAEAIDISLSMRVDMWSTT